MHKDLESLLAEIRRLEDQLEDHWDSLRQRFDYTLQDGKVRFESAVVETHRRLRDGLFGYVARARLSHLLTAPVIYALIVPLVFLDICVMIYQHICFRAYDIAIVQRKDYIVIDRNRLGYLNGLQKLNCVYCGYAGGLISYVQEVIARTEQYWCPIKHARRVRNRHSRYAKFSEYGDATNYHVHLKDLRKELADEKAGK